VNAAARSKLAPGSTLSEPTLSVGVGSVTTTVALVEKAPASKD
jgi:hypothetical protein